MTAEAEPALATALAGETESVPGLMAGKRGLIIGVANDHSIAWGIARACAAQGARLAFTYQDDAFRRRVEPLAQSVGGELVTDCDVSDAASLDRSLHP